MSDRSEDIPVPHMARGKELYRAGNLEAAAESFAAAARAEPRNADALFALGVVKEGLQQRAQALRHYEDAIAADPTMAKALVNAGNILRAVGDISGAQERYERALLIDKRDPHALNNLAGIAFERGQLEEAQALYERAEECGSFGARKGRAQTLARKAKAFQQSRKNIDAEQCYREALALEPRLAFALSGLGSVLLDRDERENAVTLYRQALAQDPRDFEALNNLACISLGDGDTSEAKRLFAAAAAVDPNQPEPRYNLGLMALADHDFRHGWEAYEMRVATDPDTVALSTSGRSRLGPSNLRSARRVAVRIEQGIGDQVLFSTLLPELVDAGLEAVVETDRRLLSAYRRSLPGLQFVSAIEVTAAIATCDHEIPLGSLPGVFRPTVDAFKRQPLALLRPDVDRVKETRALLPDGPNIAIAWRSFQKGRHRWMGERKSAALRHFASLAASSSLVDLQHGEVSDERANFDATYPGARFQIPGLDLFNDIEGVLAAIAASDLVITTSNAVAHFAGALGKVTWLVYLAGRPPFHYWAPRSDGRSLWYPSVEVLTHPSWITWEAAFGEVSRRFQKHRS